MPCQRKLELVVTDSIDRKRKKDRERKGVNNEGNSNEYRTNSEKKIILQPPMNKIHSVLRNLVCINTRNNSTIMTNVIFLIYTCIS